MDQRRFGGLRWPGSTSVVVFGQGELSGSGYRGNEISVVIAASSWFDSDARSVVLPVWGQSESCLP
jgi:hypothetical protein